MSQNARSRLIALKEHTAHKQVEIALALMAVIPALSLFYIGMMIGSDASYLNFASMVFILLSMVMVAVPGFLILRKYPDNIQKLRKYVTDIAEGTLPETIRLVDAQSSDDIKYIEDNFNIILNEMKNKVRVVEEQLRREHTLRETVEQQQQTLVEAERHRTMIQTLGAACHHIGQPATVLQVRMDLLRNLATSPEEVEEIEGCVKAVQSITDVVHQLQRVSEFRTVPYAHNTVAPDDEILAVETVSENPAE